MSVLTNNNAGFCGGRRFNTRIKRPVIKPASRTEVLLVTVDGQLDP